MKNTTAATTEDTTEVVPATVTEVPTTEVVAEATTEVVDPQIAAAVALLESVGYRVRTAAQVAASTAARSTMVKADPAEVAAYFAATGLNRKELAAAVGVTVSVIATVQNPKGDRWSAVRFEAAKPLIEAAVAAKVAAAATATPTEGTAEATTEVATEAA